MFKNNKGQQRITSAAGPCFRKSGQKTQGISKLVEFLPVFISAEKPLVSTFWYLSGINEGAALAALVPGAIGSGGAGTNATL
jgi:hypothetical protein